MPRPIALLPSLLLCPGRFVSLPALLEQVQRLSDLLRDGYASG